MELTNYKEITIDGKIMKLLSVNGSDIWSGVPDDLYIVQNGINKTGTDWTVEVSTRTVIEWDYSDSKYAHVMRIGARPYAYGHENWTCNSGFELDITDFETLHVRVSQTQTNKSSWNTFFKVLLGENIFEITQGISAETELIFDIHDLTGTVPVKISGSNYGDSSTGSVLRNTLINDIWLSGE